MPSRLGRYVVRRRIGAGGFATVWLAYDEQLDAPVAVKVLADNWTDDHHVRTRFLEEGRYLRRVESPHVVTVFDAGELEDGRPYLVMTYADQGTLADRLEVEGLTPAQALEVVHQVAAGLQALHDRDILHRDVKPANVLFRTVGQEMRAMVGDLGLGKALDVSSRLTMIAGTPSYVAPEQALGEAPDARADQYSLGVLTYLLLTGRAPYSHTNLRAAAAPGPMPLLSTADREFPETVDQVVGRALARDRDQRWPSVTAYADALAFALGGSADAGRIGQPWLPLDPQLTQPGPRPTPVPDAGALPDPTPPRRRGRRVLLALVGVVALVAGAAGGYLLQQMRADGDVTLTDDSGSLEVTVPGDWDAAVGAGGWAPPNDVGGDYPALSVGTSTTWSRSEAPAEGVFVGLFPGEDLPSPLPQHPECVVAEEPVSGGGERPSATVVHSGCVEAADGSASGVVVERVVQVAANRLLWIQVRSDDRTTAVRVLDTVETNGI